MVCKGQKVLCDAQAAPREDEREDAGRTNRRLKAEDAAMP